MLPHTSIVGIYGDFFRAIQLKLLLNAVRGGVSAFPEKALQRYTVQHYYRDERVGGGQISRKKA